jgi:hypothetical protein
MKFGFTSRGDQECQKPRCVICGAVLAVSNLLYFAAIWKLGTPLKWINLSTFFKRNLVESKSYISNFVSTTSNDNENALEASYRIRYRVAKDLEAHAIAENLIGPSIKDVVQCMLGENVAKKVDIVHFVNNTLSRRINDISSYVETTVVQRMKKSQ